MTEKNGINGNTNLPVPDEIQRLEREVKRLERELAKEQTLFARYKGNTEAKKQFSEIVLAERTRLELQMNLLLQNSRDFILFFDAERKLILCTESLLTALGILGSGLIKGKDFATIFTGRIPDEVIQDVEAIAVETEGGELVEFFEAQFTASLNERAGLRDYSLEVSLMRDNKNEPSGWLFFFYDNTDLVQAKRDAEKTNEAKSEFLAKISHDVRSPLTALIGLTKMLAATGLNDKQSNLLSKIQVSSDTLLELINDLLDFSKIEAGKLEITDEYFDLSALLENLSSLFEVMLKSKKLGFNTYYDPSLPEILYSDAKRIRQILSNLMNNAYKYTPSGWIDFIVNRVGEDRISFEVRDTGIGIHEEEASKLFTAFEQLDVKRNRDITGTGLGLAITKQLAELMGGTIEVESSYGEGSTFRVVLPLREGTRADLSVGEIKSKVFTAPRARVLIVDDVAVNIDIAEFMLESFCVQVERAYTGQQALDLVQQEHFDLVLMDHMMPVMDGVEATKAIRALGEPAASTVIIALTANAVTGVQEMFRHAGFNDYLSKPMDEAALSLLLYEYLPRDLIE